MIVEVALEQLGNRALIVGQRIRAEFLQPYRSPQRWARSLSFARDELVSSPRELAVRLSLDVFSRCGWSPAAEQVVAHQSELTEGRPVPTVGARSRS